MATSTFLVKVTLHHDKTTPEGHPQGVAEGEEAPEGVPTASGPFIPTIAALELVVEGAVERAFGLEAGVSAERTDK